MFSLQKQTEFEPGTVKDWPAWDAACHVEGPTPTLLSHAVLIPGRWVRTRAPRSLADSPEPAATFSPPPPGKQAGEQSSRQFFLPQCRTFPLPSSG